MTLDQLRIFVAVAERQHVTRAAEALGLTQSAVSAAIAGLEGRHGVALFDRVGRSILLNDAGRAFLPEAAAVLARAAAAEAVLRDLAGLGRGTLSIMASQTIGGYWLPEHLGAYRRRHPGIEIAVGIGNTSQVAAAVETGTAELGLIEGRIESRLLAVRPIATDELIVIVAPGHPWASEAPRTPEALAGSSWVVREPGSGTRGAFDAMLGRKGISPGRLAGLVVLPSNEAVLGAIEAGLGATLVSRSAVRARISAGTLAAVALPPERRSYDLVTRRERAPSRAAQAFLALCGAAAS